MVRRLAGLILFGVMVPLPASAAQPLPPECRTIADPAARLACYDAAAGATPASAPSAPASIRPVERGPAASSARRPDTAVQPGGQSRDELKRRSGFDSSIAAVVPLRHGYYRLELADGTAYETTIVASPPPAGAAVRVRRTLVGTTYLDLKGWSPIPVRLASRQ